MALYLSVLDHVLQHGGTALVPRPPGELVVVGLAGARLAEDDGGVGRLHLSRQAGAVEGQRDAAAAGSRTRPDRRLLPQNLVWAGRPEGWSQLDPGGGACMGQRRKKVGSAPFCPQLFDGLVSFTVCKIEILG